MRPPSNLPKRFDDVGAFLWELRKLQEDWPGLTDAERLARCGAFFLHKSPSALNDTIRDFEYILNAIYDEPTAHGCSGGSTRIRA